MSIFTRGGFFITIWCRSFSLRRYISGSHTSSRFAFSSVYETEKVHLASARLLVLSSRERGKKGRKTNEKEERKRVAGSRRAISMHLRFPRWCNKLLLIRLRSCLTLSRHVRVDLSLFLPLYVLHLHRASCVTTHVYIFRRSLSRGESRGRVNQVCPPLISAAALAYGEPPTSFSRPPTPKPRSLSFFFILCSPASSAERWLWPSFLCGLTGVNSVV